MSVRIGAWVLGVVALAVALSLSHSPDARAASGASHSTGEAREAAEHANLEREGEAERDAEEAAPRPTFAARPADLGVLLRATNALEPSDDTIVRSFRADVQPCSIGTGLAFDGSSLLISCWYTDVIDVVSVEDGTRLTEHTIAGMTGIGALTYDNARKQLWACSAGSGNGVYTIDLQTDTATHRFDGAGCIDGLSFDATDDTLWSSADAASSVQHYQLDGTLIRSSALNGTLDNCGNSGLAVGATQVFMANDGCSEIFRAGKDNVGVTDADNGDTTLIGSYPARLEDLECDDQTFPGKTVIWSKDAYDPTINAFDVGSVDCGIGAYRDRDGDGLSDELEQTPEYQAMGASPDHKDLFAEIDYYADRGHKIGPVTVGGWSLQPSAAVLDRVVTAYDNMGVTNPDGVDGIHLHLDGGPGSVMNPATGEKWGARSRSNAIYGAAAPATWDDAQYWAHLDELRDGNVDADRKGVFHYILVADHMNASRTLLGLSRGIPGHDIVIAGADMDGADGGEASYAGSRQADVTEAVTIAHELGHNIGLGHGGAANPAHPGTQNVNRKANYLSVMNYFYSTTGMILHIGGRDVGGSILFSPQQLDTLDVTDLDEQAGLNPDPFGHWVVKYNCFDGQHSADPWGSIDWDCRDGIANGSTNYFLQKRPRQEDIDKDPDLASHVYGSNDYAHLRFWGVGDAWDAANEAMQAEEQPGVDEPTTDELAADGDLYAWPTLLADGSQTVAVPAHSGVIDVAVNVSDPTDQDVPAAVELAGATAAERLRDASLTVPARGAAVAHVGIDTDALAAGDDRSIDVRFSVPDNGVVADVGLDLQVTANQGKSSCDQAAQVVSDPAATPAQVSAARAVVTACNPPAGAQTPPAPQPSGSGPTPGGAPRGIATLDRAALARALRAFLAVGARTPTRRLVKKGARAAFAAPTAGTLTVRWRQAVKGSHRRGRTLASGRLRYAKAGRRVVVVRLSRAGRKFMQRHRKARVRMTASFRPKGRQAVSVSRVAHVKRR